MQIGIDYGSGDESVLFVQAARKGATSRALALQAALRNLGRAVSIDDCLRFATEGGPVRLNEYPEVHSKEPES